MARTFLSSVARKRQNWCDGIRDRVSSSAFLAASRHIRSAFHGTGNRSLISGFPRLPCGGCGPMAAQRSNSHLLPCISSVSSGPPDGSQIAFLADDPGSPFKIYLIPSQGGSPEELLPQRHERQGMPTWSQDGRRIAFGDFPIVFEKGTGQ